MAYTSPNIPSSGATFAQMLGLGASAWLELYVSKIAAYAAPSATPTVSVSGSGGTLPAGVYYGKVTYVDSSLNAQGRFGETTPGPEFTFTQVSGDEPVITFADTLPAWASGRNLYLTAAGGGSGSETLAATGQSGATYTLTAAPAASTVTPPAVNTTTIQGTAPPSVAPTVAATADGSSTLPTATYYVVVTETNGIGETTASPVSAGQAITAGTNHLTVTPHAFQAGNTACNIYVGTSSTGPFTLAVSGHAASAVAISAPLPSNSFAVSPPLANSTGLTTIMAPPAPNRYGAPAGTPTVVVSGTGGYLPTGTYYGKITYSQYGLNSGEAAGETTAGTEFTFTQTANATPIITLNDGNGPPSTALSRNLYLTAAGGGSGTEVLAFTGITGPTFTVASAPPTSSVSPPSSNTTTVLGAPAMFPATPQVSARRLSAVRAAQKGRLQDVWDDFAATLDAYCHGDPVGFMAVQEAIRRAHTFASIWTQALTEIGTLIDANPGTLTTTVTPIGLAKTVRVHP